MNIKYVGMGVLNEDEKFKLKQLSERFYPKIKRKFKDPLLELILKKYNVAGKRSKISVHAKVLDPILRFSSEAFDWDIATAAHKAFNKLEKEMEHKAKN